MKNDLFYKAIFKSSIFSSLNKKTQNLYFEIIENCNSKGVVVDEAKVEALKKNVVEINKLSKENFIYCSDGFGIWVSYWCIYHKPYIDC